MAEKTLSQMDLGFGVVTVINATCVPIEVLNKNTTVKGGAEGTDTWEDYCKNTEPKVIAKTVLDAYDASECCKIDTLKIANINIEGPSKTITGGQYANPLIKFGKTATCEMQDALGHVDALKILAGVEVDSDKGMHFTSKFGKPVCIIGDTFVIDRETGDQVNVTEIVYQFLPDSVISLTQDAEGDATVFDLNGSLMATDVNGMHGAFYSIIDEVKPTA